LIHSIITVVILTLILILLFIIYLTLKKMPTCLEKPPAMDQIFEMLKQNNVQKQEIMLQFKALEVSILELKMLSK
jgi:hypothetical protein